MTGPDETTEPEWNRLVYEMLYLRHISTNSLIWQTPALALTAQAFLMTICLAGDVSRAARGLAALLGLLVSLACVQLMFRHRHLAVSDRDLLESIETKLGLWVISNRTAQDPKGGPRNWQSHRLWIGLLLVFSAAFLIVVVLTIWRPATLAVGASA
jgi:small-conductance mechanosensitive channel